MDGSLQAHATGYLRQKVQKVSACLTGPTQHVWPRTALLAASSINDTCRMPTGTCIALLGLEQANIDINPCLNIPQIV